MSNYHNVIYGNYKKSTYPERLAEYLSFKYRRYVEDHILDLGCGGGTYVDAFHKWHFHVYGIDATRRVYRGPQPQYQYNLDTNIDFNKDILPYDDNKFDLIFNKSVLEHVNNTSHLLGEAYRILSPGGKLVVLLPSWEFNYRWFYDDPTHVKPFHRKGLQDALRMAGFKNVKVEYFYHLPLFWKYPWLKPLARLVRLLPDDWRWFDWQQQKMNIGIRFCKEVQLLAVAEK